MGSLEENEKPCSRGAAEERSGEVSDYYKPLLQLPDISQELQLVFTKVRFENGAIEA
jgi:hypothetical protein